MSVAGIFGSSFVNYAAQSVQSRMQQARKDFQQLGQDLQSGNLSAAQSDFAAMQKFGPQSNSSSPTQNNSLFRRIFSSFRRTYSPGTLRLRSRITARFSRTSSRRRLICITTGTMAAAVATAAPAVVAG